MSRFPRRKNAMESLRAMRLAVAFAGFTSRLACCKLFMYSDYSGLMGIMAEYDIMDQFLSHLKII